MLLLAGVGGLLSRAAAGALVALANHRKLLVPGAAVAVLVAWAVDPPTGVHVMHEIGAGLWDVAAGLGTSSAI